MSRAVETTPLVITVAPNGARRTKRDHPALPIAPDELARTAVSSLRAGAAMLHLHVREPGGRHSLDAGAYRAAIHAIRQAVGDALVIQVTTEGAGIYGPADQMALVRELRPEAVSLAVRELIPDDASERPAAELFEWLAAQPTRTQLIVYSVDDLRRYQSLRDRGVITGEDHSLLFVLGRYSGRAGEPLELLPFLEAHERDTPWSVCAFGPREHVCAVAAAALGGHVRVGFENNLLLRDGRSAPDNAALVTQMREAAHALGRPLADAARARDLL